MRTAWLWPKAVIAAWPQRIACEACNIAVLDMHDAQVAARARALGLKSVPAVAVNGELAGCWAGRADAKRSLLKSSP
jgi:glutaredoxin 3